MECFASKAFRYRYDKLQTKPSRYLKAVKAIARNLIIIKPIENLIGIKCAVDVKSLELATRYTCEINNLWLDLTALGDPLVMSYLSATKKTFYCMSACTNNSPNKKLKKAINRGCVLYRFSP